MPPVILVAMPDLLTQLSRWEWLGLAVTVFILNTLFLKWFLAWSQSDASDDEKEAIGGNASGSGQKGAPMLATAGIGGGGNISGRNSPVMPGRPRRRKHLSDASSPGTTSAPDEEASQPVTEETPKPELEPVSGSSLPAPSSEVPITSRIPAEVRLTGPEETKTSGVVRSAEPRPRPTRRLSIPVVAVPAPATPRVEELVTASTESSVIPAAEDKPLVEATPEPISALIPSPVPAPEEHVAPVSADTPSVHVEPEPMPQPVAVDALAALGHASFGKHAPANIAETKESEPEPLLATPAVTSSLSLHVDESAPIDPALAEASAPIEVADVASEPSLVTATGNAADVPSSADNFALPATVGASFAHASTNVSPQEAVVEATTSAENLPAMTSEPSELSTATKTMPTHSSADFAPAPSIEPETHEGSVGSVPPAGGRPVIARRAVGPARIFLTREFSSLRIKSNLTPPSNPSLAAAHAKDLAAKVTPSIPPVSSADEEDSKSSETEKPGSDLMAVASPTAHAPTETTPESTPSPTESEPAPVAAEMTTPSSTEAVAEMTPAAEPEAFATSEPELPSAALTHETPAAVAEEELTPVAAHASSESETTEHAEVPAAVAEHHIEHVETPADVQESGFEHLSEEQVPAPVLEVPAIAPEPEPVAHEESFTETPAPVDIEAAPAMLPPVSTTAETSATHLIAEGVSPEAELTHSTTRPATSHMTTATTSNGERATAQLTFSFEVASLQLTPFFKLGSVQLRPLSNVVSMQLAHGDNATTNPLSANIAFEILATTTGGGNHGPVQALVLKPLSEARAAATPQPKLAVNAVQLTHGAEAGPIQITPQQTSATNVQVLATFAIAGIDFTPLFEIGSMRLEPTSAQVLLRVSSASGQSSSLDHLPPSFELTDVQITSEGQISGFTLVPRAS